MSQFTSTVLITGGTTGLGYQCALHIALTHPKYLVIIASRSNPNADTTINQLTHHSHPNVEYLPLDLSSLSAIRAFTTTYISSNYPPLISLILNAGIQITGHMTYTTDNIETTFGVNHLGHALLFHLLRPHLSSTAHIIFVASGTHDPAQKSGMPDAIYNTAEELAHPTAETMKYDGRQRYSTSKLCNILYTYALHRHLSQNSKTTAVNKLTVNAFDPGLLPGTQLARTYPVYLRFLWHHILPHCLPLLRLIVSSNNIYTPKDSGTRLAKLGLGEIGGDVSGRYFEGGKEIKSSVASYDEEVQDELWHWTGMFLGRDEGERKNFLME